MITVTLKGFMQLVEKLRDDREVLEKVYSAWSTGQPINLPYEKMYKFLGNNDEFSKALKKFYKGIVKGKLEKFYFLVGEFGSGKTQLMYLIRDELKRRFGIDSVYVSLEEYYQLSEKDILIRLNDSLKDLGKNVVLMIDDLDFYYAKVENVGKAIYDFVSTIYNFLKGPWCGKIKTVLLSMSREFFKKFEPYLTPIHKHGFSWKVLIELDLDLEKFLETSIDLGFKLLAVQFLLEYYEGYREKIIKYFDLIWEYLYNLTLRISKFGIRTVGLYLKMVNDRLVDFIRYIDPNKKVPCGELSIDDLIKIIDQYLYGGFNDVILAFDRFSGYDMYKIVYKRSFNGFKIGELHIESVGDEQIPLKAKINIYYLDSEKVYKALSFLESIKDDSGDYNVVIVFIKKKRRVREEIEKVYLKAKEKMLKFSIIPIDEKMMKFAMHLMEDGQPSYVEKNTTAKKDLEEAINIAVNNKLFEYYRSKLEKNWNCEDFIKAIYLITQTWILKSGFCRVKKRDIDILKMFYEALFPKNIKGIGLREVFGEILKRLQKEELIRVKSDYMILGEKIDEKKILEKVAELVKEVVCR